MIETVFNDKVKTYFKKDKPFANEVTYNSDGGYLRFKHSLNGFAYFVPFIRDKSQTYSFEDIYNVNFVKDHIDFNVISNELNKIAPYCTDLISKRARLLKRDKTPHNIAFALFGVLNPIVAEAYITMLLHKRKMADIYESFQYTIWPLSVLFFEKTSYRYNPETGKIEILFLKPDKEITTVIYEVSYINEENNSINFLTRGQQEIDETSLFTKLTEIKLENIPKVSALTSDYEIITVENDVAISVDKIVKAGTKILVNNSPYVLIFETNGGNVVVNPFGLLTDFEFKIKKAYRLSHIDTQITMALSSKEDIEPGYLHTIDGFSPTYVNGYSVDNKKIKYIILPDTSDVIKINNSGEFVQFGNVISKEITRVKDNVYRLNNYYVTATKDHVYFRKENSVDFKEGLIVTDGGEKLIYVVGVNGIAEAAAIDQYESVVKSPWFVYQREFYLADSKKVYTAYGIAQHCFTYSFVAKNVLLKTKDGLAAIGYDYGLLSIDGDFIGDELLDTINKSIAVRDITRVDVDYDNFNFYRYSMKEGSWFFVDARVNVTPLFIYKHPVLFRGLSIEQNTDGSINSSTVMTEVYQYGSAFKERQLFIDNFNNSRFVEYRDELVNRSEVDGDNRVVYVKADGKKEIIDVEYAPYGDSIDNVINRIKKLSGNKDTTYFMSAVNPTEVEEWLYGTYGYSKLKKKYYYKNNSLGILIYSENDFADDMQFDDSYTLTKDFNKRTVLFKKGDIQIQLTLDFSGLKADVRVDTARHKDSDVEYVFDGGKLFKNFLYTKYGIKNGLLCVIDESVDETIVDDSQISYLKNSKEQGTKFIVKYNNEIVSNFKADYLFNVINYKKPELISENMYVINKGLTKINKFVKKFTKEELIDYWLENFDNISETLITYDMYATQEHYVPVVYNVDVKLLPYLGEKKIKIPPFTKVAFYLNLAENNSFNSSCKLCFKDFPVKLIKGFVDKMYSLPENTVISFYEAIGSVFYKRHINIDDTEQVFAFSELYNNAKAQLVQDFGPDTLNKWMDAAYVNVRWELYHSYEKTREMEDKVWVIPQRFFCDNSKDVVFYKQVIDYINNISETKISANELINVNYQTAAYISNPNSDYMDCTISIYNHWFINENGMFYDFDNILELWNENLCVPFVEKVYQVERIEK